MVTVSATAAGVRVASFRVEYSAGSEKYLLDVPWEMVLCGSESDPALC